MEPIAIDIESLEVPVDDPAFRADISNLTGPQKAAIIVRKLASDGADLSLHRLPEHVQAALIREVAALGHVPAEIVEAVAEEFGERIRSSAFFGPDGLANAIELLRGTVLPSVERKIREEAGEAEPLDPWVRIAEKEVGLLLPILEGECTEVAAILLSKLPVAKAADLLGMLPGAQARQITYAISLTSGVGPDAVERIGSALARLLDIEPERVFSETPVERVGAILNTSRTATRNTVLAGLEEDDAAFAEEVRRAIFTFVNIPERIDPRDIPRILRPLERETIARALAANTADMIPVREFILGAISQRLADSIRDSIEEISPVSEAASEQAMDAVVAIIRDMEARNEIYLRAEANEPPALPDTA